MDYMECLEKCLDMADLSTCNKKHVGAVIVKDDEYVSFGYNTHPFSDEYENCLRPDIVGATEVESCYGIHAEQMAILNAGIVKGGILDATIYVAAKKNINGEWVYKPTGKRFSCTICARIIVGAKLGSVVTFTEDGPIERSAKDAYFEAYEHLKEIKSSLSEQ